MAMESLMIVKKILRKKLIINKIMKIIYNKIKMLIYKLKNKN